MKMKHDVRTITASDMRATDANEIIGYALKFNEYSENLGGFFEVIKPGSLDGVLEKSDVRALFNHDPSKVLGRTGAGNLKLEIDDVGLKYTITPDTSITYVRDLMANIKSRNITQSSFAFRAKFDGYEYVEDEERGTVKVITKFDKIFDISPVTYPAYHNTETSVRSLDEYKQKQENENKPDPKKGSNQSAKLIRRKILVIENGG